MILLAAYLILSLICTALYMLAAMNLKEIRRCPE